MRTLKELLRSAAMLIRGGRFDRELAEELEFHRALEAEEQERGGSDPDTARAAASRRLGNDLLLREESRDEWGWGWLDRLRADVRYGVRMLRRNPGYTAAAAATLALAIGANCLMFSVADNLALRPFPYPHPERLVFLWSEFDHSQRAYVSFPDFEDYRARNHVFESMGAAIYTTFTIDAGGYPDMAHGRRATADFFTTLGVGARVGRAFTPDDERPDAPPVVLLSDSCWRRRFHADPRIVGSRVVLGLNDGPRQPYMVIGILPPALEAAYPRSSEIWGVMSAASEDGRAREAGGFEVLARLRPDASFGAAAAELRGIGTALAMGHPHGKMTGAQLMSFQENLIGDTKQYMKILLGAVGFVLLLACANAANLALARGAERDREMTIRAAIGAGRGRLFRQILTENVLLGILGGAAGAMLAAISTRWIRAIAPPFAPRVDSIAVDGRVLLFTLALSLATGIVFGLAPALGGSRARLSAALQARSRSVTQGTLRSALVTVEVALGFLLVVGASLMINSFIRLLRVDPGFARSELLLVETHASRTAFPDERRRIAAVTDVLDRIRGIPRVLYVGASDFRPLGSVMNVTARRGSESGAPLAFQAESVDGDYFAAIGTPVARGRNFGEQDGPSGQPVALVNQAAAARYWPGADPIGETLALNVGKKKTLVQIVGVVGDVRRRGLDRPPDPALYVPRPQANFADHMDLVIRPEPGVPAAPLAPAVRTRMAAVDRSFSADSVTTMEAVIDRQLARPRFSATILGIFGFLALALTVTGVYGVTAYTVRARRHEIGVRMALGADPRRLVGFVIGRGGRSIAVGLALGVLGAAAATRLLTRLLYEVKPLDLPTFVGVAGLLTAFALLASYLPARRAAKVDPMESVRCD